VDGGAIPTGDVIDGILGAAAVGPIAALRSQKPALATELQAYYRSLSNRTRRRPPRSR